jgi:hypothetical protein
MQSCPCYKMDSSSVIMKRDVCGDRACETLVRYQRHLDGYIFVNDTIKPLADSFIRKYKSSLYNLKLSSIIYLLAAASVIPNDQSIFLKSIALPLICYIETSGLDYYQQDFESSVAFGMFSGFLNSNLRTVQPAIFEVSNDTLAVLNARLEVISKTGCPIKPLPRLVVAQID